MSYNLGIVTRNKSALIVTNDYKYDEFVLLKPTSGLKVEGQLVQLVCICFGDKEKRSLTHKIMTNAEQADYTKEDILAMMKEHGVELRVITDKAVHVFQYIVMWLSMVWLIPITPPSGSATRNTENCFIRIAVLKVNLFIMPIVIKNCVGYLSLSL
ncbi:hypothetical protein Churi_gp333 [Pseudomonas phage Churi]|nr:hypothetical protein Churi01_gp333 [Pseudomonas phage Churi01]